jgi:hypothetical protein
MVDFQNSTNGHSSTLLVLQTHLEDVLGPHVLHAAKAHLVLAWHKGYRSWDIVSADVAFFIPFFQALLHYLG